MRDIGKIVETDGRGRATIGHPGQRYLLRESADGALVLEPAVVVSELERRFMANDALRAQISYAKAHPEDQVPRRRRQLSD